MTFQNLSLNGLDKALSFVVAQISVKFAIGILTLCAQVHFQTIMSITKSSIAV
jgi:hypothetical protein